MLLACLYKTLHCWESCSMFTLGIFWQNDKSTNFKLGEYNKTWISHKFSQEFIIILDKLGSWLTKEIELNLFPDKSSFCNLKRFPMGSQGLLPVMFSPVYDKFNVFRFGKEFDINSIPYRKN